jgi:hypothetical protein
LETFEHSAADFARFAEKQGYPPNLLWVTSADVVFWRMHFFVWKGVPGERRNEAERRFEEGIARNLGIAIEGKCKTSDFTVCRVYVPKDREDAQERWIPSTGVKFIVAKDQPPAILVKNRVAWWLLRAWTKGSPAWW